MRAARRNFSETLVFLSREFGAKLAFFRRRTLSFSDLNAIMTQSKLIDVIEYAQRMLAASWPVARKFWARGVPEFRKFCKFFARFFAQILRDLDAALALYLALERIPTRKRAATNI